MDAKSLRTDTRVNRLKSKACKGFLFYLSTTNLFISSWAKIQRLASMIIAETSSPESPLRTLEPSFSISEPSFSMSEANSKPLDLSTRAQLRAFEREFSTLKKDLLKCTTVSYRLTGGFGDKLVTPRGSWYFENFSLWCSILLFQRQLALEIWSKETSCIRTYGQ